MDRTETRRVVDRFLAETLNGHEGACATPLIVDQVSRQRASAFRAAFPDLRVTAHRVLVDGGLVAVHLTARGTHKGVFQGCPPTGREWSATCTAIYRVEAGEITEAWVNWDLLAILEQLGAIERAPTVSA